VASGGGKGGGEVGGEDDGKGGGSGGGEGGGVVPSLYLAPCLPPWSSLPGVWRPPPRAMLLLRLLLLSMPTAALTDGLPPSAAVLVP
jgi:hypothetical protein